MDFDYFYVGEFNVLFYVDYSIVRYSFEVFSALDYQRIECISL